MQTMGSAVCFFAELDSSPMFHPVLQLCEQEVMELVDTLDVHEDLWDQVIRHEAVSAILLNQPVLEFLVVGGREGKIIERFLSNA